jgi:hypothetical protein
MTNGQLLEALADDGALGSAIVAGIVVATGLTIWGASAAIHRIRSGDQIGRTVHEHNIREALRDQADEDTDGLTVEPPRWWTS